MNSFLDERATAQPPSWSESFEREFETIGQANHIFEPSERNNSSRVGTEVLRGEAKSDGNPFSAALRRETHELGSVNGISNENLFRSSQLGHRSRFKSSRNDTTGHSLAFAMSGSKQSPGKSMAATESASVTGVQYRSQAAPRTLQQITGLKQPAWNYSYNSNAPPDLYSQFNQMGRARDGLAPLVVGSIQSESASVRGNPFNQRDEMPHLLSSLRGRDGHPNKLTVQSPLKSAIDLNNPSTRSNNVLEESSLALIPNRSAEFRQSLESKSNMDTNLPNRLLASAHQPAPSRDHALKIFSGHSAVGKAALAPTSAGSFLSTMEEQKSIREFRSHIHTLTLENQKLQLNLDNSLRKEQQNSILIAKQEGIISGLQAEIDPLKHEVHIKSGIIERLEREINMWKDATVSSTGKQMYSELNQDTLQNHHPLESSSFLDNKSASETRIVRTEGEDSSGTEKHFDDLLIPLGKVRNTEKLPDALSEVLKLLQYAQRRERSCADLLESREAAILQKKKVDFSGTTHSFKNKPLADDFFSTSAFHVPQVDPFNNVMTIDNDPFQTPFNPLFVEDSAALVGGKGDLFGKRMSNLMEKSSNNDPFVGESEGTSPVGGISYINTFSEKDPAFAADSDTFSGNASPANVEWTVQPTVSFAKIDDDVTLVMDSHVILDDTLEHATHYIEIPAVNVHPPVIDDTSSGIDQNMPTKFDEPAMLGNVHEESNRVDTEFVSNTLNNNPLDMQEASGDIANANGEEEDSGDIANANGEEEDSGDLANANGEYSKSFQEAIIEDTVGGKSTESTAVYVTGEDCSEGPNVESPNSQVFVEDSPQGQNHGPFPSEQSHEETVNEQCESLNVQVFGVQERKSDQNYEESINVS